MTAIFELVQLAVGLAVTGQMIASAVIKKQIKDYIDEHKEELQILRDIDIMIKNTFDNTILNNQLSQLGLISGQIWEQIASNMKELQQITESITGEFGNILAKRSVYQTSGKEIAIMSMVGLFSVGTTIKFIAEQVKVQWKGVKDFKSLSVSELGNGMRKAIFRQRAVRSGISEVDQAFVMQQYQEALKIQNKKMTLKELVKEGWNYFKENKLKALGMGLLQALRVCMVAAGIYMFIQGIGDINKMVADFDELKSQLGTGGHIEKNQLNLMMVMGMLAMDASNILYQSYNLVQDFRNVLQMMKNYLHSLYSTLDEQAKIFDPQNFVGGFNYEYIRTVTNRAGQIYNKFLSGSKQYEDKKEKDPEGARNSLKASIKEMKNLMGSLNPSKQEIDSGKSLVKVPFRDMIKTMAQTFEKHSTVISMKMDNYAGKMSNYKNFIRQCKSVFYKRKHPKKPVKDPQQKDIKYLKRIIGQYNRWFINPSLPQDKKLNTSYDSDDELEDIIKEDLRADQSVKASIFGFVGTFTDDFFADSQDGKSLFGCKFSEYKRRDQASIEKLLSALSNTPNVIYLPNSFPNEKEDSEAQTKGKLMSIEQLRKRLYAINKEFHPDSKKYEIFDEHRVNEVEQTIKEIYILKRKAEDDNKLYQEKKEVHCFRFARSYIFKATNLETKKEENYKMTDMSEDPKDMNWKLKSLDELQKKKQTA